MDANAPNVTWSDPIKDSDGTADHHFVGTMNEQITNYAGIDSLCEIFAIWTVADDTAMILFKKKNAKDTQAALGWTLSECEQHYAEPTTRAEKVSGDKLFYVFSTKEYEMGVDIHNGTVSRVMYHDASGFDLAAVQTLLESNAPEATWGAPYKDDSNDGDCYNGVVGGVTAYYAGVTNAGTLLVIWTKADNDAVNSAHKQDASDR
jgi:hypothetical protein